MAVNDDLLDASIRRAIFLERVKTGIWNDLRKLLRSVEKDLQGRIEDGTGTTFQSRRLRALLREVREIIEGGSEGFEDRLRAAGQDLGEIEATAAARSLTQSVPLRVDFVIPSAGLLEAAIAAKPFQGAFLKDWVSQWSEATITRVERTIRIGIVEGESVEDIVRRVIGTRANDFADGVLETSRRSARTIVRTYVNHVGTAAREATYAANSDVIDRVLWVSTLDGRTSLICIGLDGKVFPLDEGPRPPAHPNCRSVVAPLIKGREDLIRSGVLPPGSRSSIDGQVPEDVTFDAFLRNKSAEFQDDVLGPARGKLFRDGLRADRFIDDQNRVLTLDQLREL